MAGINASNVLQVLWMLSWLGALLTVPSVLMQHRFLTTDHLWALILLFFGNWHLIFSLHFPTNNILIAWG